VYTICQAPLVGVGTPCDGKYPRCKCPVQYRWDENNCASSEGYVLVAPTCSMFDSYTKTTVTKYSKCECTKKHTQCDEGDGMACTGWICNNSVCTGCRCTISGASAPNCECGGGECTAKKCGGTVCIAYSGCNACPPPPPPPPEYPDEPSTPPCDTDPNFQCSKSKPNCSSGESPTQTTEIDKNGCSHDCYTGQCELPQCSSGCSRTNCTKPNEPSYTGCSNGCWKCVLPTQGQCVGFDPPRCGKDSQGNCFYRCDPSGFSTTPCSPC